MKKFLSLVACGFLVFGLVGCGSKDEPKSDDKVGQETKKTDLEIVSDVFTLESETTSTGTIMGNAKDGDNIMFKMYIEIKGDDAKIAESIGVSNGNLVYCADGKDSETYLVELNKVFVTVTNADADTMKKSMDEYLSSKNITIEQLTKAMKEKFNIK